MDNIYLFAEIAKEVLNDRSDVNLYISTVDKKNMSIYAASNIMKLNKSDIKLILDNHKEELNKYIDDRVNELNNSKII